jgi:serine/threonine protein kinase
MKGIMKWINKVLQKWRKGKEREGKREVVVVVAASMSTDSIPTQSIAMNDSKAVGKTVTPVTLHDHVHQSTRINQRYRIGAVIGEGSFGLVCAAYDLLSTRHVALKFIYRDKVRRWVQDPVLGRVPSEVHYLRGLSMHRHPNIIEFIDYFEGDDGYLVLVTELYGRQWRQHANKTHLSKEMPRDLFEFIEASHDCPLPDQLVYFIFDQLMSTVLFLRSLGLLHRDIKDENVLIDDHYRLKLIDFGSCTEWKGGRDVMDKFNGTIAFAPPEALAKRPYGGTAAEVWSLGSLLYTLRFRRAPFEDVGEIRHFPPRLPPHTPGTSLEDLIARMLDKDPDRRIPLMSILSHPWMLDHRQCIAH